MAGHLPDKLIMEGYIFLLLVIFTILLGNDAAKWTYDGDLGPKYWHHLFPDGCSGKQQSPIDIKTASSQYDSKLNDFALWHDPPKPGSRFRIHNNGHSITVDTLGPFHVANGGLPSVYSTAQFHFHWGHANHQGSEHLVDQMAFPLELHVVNYDSVTYQSLPMAMVKPMGLAVLGVMFKIGEEENEALEPIIQGLKHVKDPENENDHEILAQPIRNFLPADTSKYYRYNGSLTTPGCFESVIWTVFKEPKYISQRQMMEFRSVLQNKRHKKGKSHHKRSATKEEKIVREVMEEAGIAGDPIQEMELEMALEEKKTEDQKPPPTAGPTLGDPPKKFHLLHGENPDTNEMKKVNQSSDHDDELTHYKESETEKHLEKLVIDLEHENEELIEEIERLKLVDNFRPVQPLNGRIVYRSFMDLEDIPSMEISGPGNKSPQSGEPCNNANNIAFSWSILLMTVFVILFK